MPHVEVTKVVAGAPDAVYRRLSDMEAYPKFMDAVESIKVLRREGNETESAWHCRLQGAPFRWVERDTFLEQEHRIVYRQISGDLKQFEGEWRLLPAEGGTEVTLTVDFDLGIPMLSKLFDGLARVVLRRNVESMLSDLSRELAG